MATLAQNILDGVAGHAATFPSIDATALGAALTGFTESASAVASKNTMYTNLENQVRKAIKAAETDCFSDPTKLVYIGWGPKATPTPLAVPGACNNLRSSYQGPGIINLEFDKPTSGGTVRNYALYRTNDNPEGAGLASWTLVDFYYSNKITAENQPRGTQPYYKVLAVNASGNGPESNTLPVVL